MSLEKNWEEILSFAVQNDKNRSEAIKNASRLISVLIETQGKSLTKEELKKIAGGSYLMACIQVK